MLVAFCVTYHNIGAARLCLKCPVCNEGKVLQGQRSAKEKWLWGPVSCIWLLGPFTCLGEWYKFTFLIDSYSFLIGKTQTIIFISVPASQASRPFPVLGLLLPSLAALRDSCSRRESVTLAFFSVLTPGEGYWQRFWNGVEWGDRRS